MTTISMRVLLFPEAGMWVAQGLEHDICIQGDSLDQVRKRFNAALQMEMDEGGGSLDHVEAAPSYFFRRWEQTGKFVPEVESQNHSSFGLQLALAA